MTLYGFYYNSCIHESAGALISLHKHEQNATEAMEAHKAKEQAEWEELYKDSDQKIRDYCKFGQHEDWYVLPIEVQD